MAVKERDYMKGSPAASPGGKLSLWMTRLNDFGERHATAIIAASTVLTILTVILFATYFYNRSQNEKAEAELSEVTSPDRMHGESTIDKLKELKEKFGGTPSGPRIIYKLAGLYADEGRLEEARKEYEEFQTRFPTDPLAERATHAIQTLETNLRFEKQERERRMKEAKLQTHPRLFAEAKDPRLQWGPVPEPRPTVELEIATVKVTLELYQDEAPKAVAAFLKQVEDKYFDGLKIDLVNTDERIVTQPKPDKPAAAIPYETTVRPAEAGSLVLIRKDGGAENVGGQFQVLLKELPDLKDVTIFGIVRDGVTRLKGLKKDDVIKSAKVISRRGEVKSAPTAPKPQ